MKIIWYIYGWIFVRPRRWFFGKMLWKGSFGLRLWFKRNEYWCKDFDSFCDKWKWPNLHWWILYKTVFNFCSWLYWDGWRPFCKWGNVRLTYPPIARMLHCFGLATAGYHISGMQCFHCGSPKGCQVDLSEDDTGKTFILEKSWSISTQDGTDHRFCGTTICPVCGYKQYYEDGSL